MPSGLYVFGDDAGYVLGRGKQAIVGLRQTGFDFSELPFFTGHEILNGLGCHVGTGAILFLGKLVEPLGGDIRNADGEGGHARDFRLFKIFMGEPL